MNSPNTPRHLLRWRRRFGAALTPALVGTGVALVRGARVRADDSSDPDREEDRSRALVLAGVAASREAFRFLMADHGDKKGLLDRKRKRIALSIEDRKDEEIEDKIVSGDSGDSGDSDPDRSDGIVAFFVRALIVMLRTICGDHYGVRGHDAAHKDDAQVSDADEESTPFGGGKDADEPPGDFPPIVRHSAKCAILTRKGGMHCTVRIKDDGEYVSHSEERCVTDDNLKNHNYRKIFTGSDDPYATPDELSLHILRARKGFRERHIVAYENRLRMFSTPDKIFRYFATLQTVEDDKHHKSGHHGHHSHHDIRHHSGVKTRTFMNPEDFVRSISPNSIQPDGLGLDSFRTFDAESDTIVCDLMPDSTFFMISPDGLINYADYIFLVMVLTHPVRHFRMAFNLFDDDGNGLIDARKFHLIESVMLGQTEMWKKHRDHGSSILNIHSNAPKTRVAKFFFGPNLDQSMAVEDFITFQRRLKAEVNSLEFDSYMPDEYDSIPGFDFLDSMTKFHHGSASALNRIKKMKRNMKNFYNKNSSTSKTYSRVTRDDFLQLNVFFSYPILMKIAFKSYHMAGVKITQDVFHHVAKQVAGVDLSKEIVEMLFVMMGDIEDNDFSERPFRKLVKARTTFGLKTSQENPSFFAKFEAMSKCLGLQYKAFVGYVLNGGFNVCSFCRK